jgi:uncharacterized protein YdeI (BOF family)
MSRVRHQLARLLWVAVILAAGLPVMALDRDRIGDILARPDTFDRREVVLVGRASAVDPRTSQRGNDYFTFRLADETGASVKVFSWGKLTISPEDRVEVHGRFQKERRVGRYTFTNEIEALRIRKLP